MCPEANDAQRGRSQPLEIGALIDPLAELAGHGYVLADSSCKPLNSEIAHHEPQLDRAEAPPELRSVIHEVLDLVGITSAQVLRYKAECLTKHVHSLAEEHAQINRNEQPFVRVHHDRICVLASVENPLHLRYDRRRSRVSRVDMKPQILTSTNLRDLRDRIDAGRRGGPNRRDDAEGAPSIRAVFFNCGRERARVHSELSVGRDLANTVLPDAKRDCGFVNRRVRLLRAIQPQAGIRSDEPFLADIQFFYRLPRGCYRAQA